MHKIVMRRESGNPRHRESEIRNEVCIASPYDEASCRDGELSLKAISKTSF